MVNIKEVYDTVLTILNKEQRGYLDPTEFNDLSRLAQREIFESYFSKFAQVPSTGPDVADPQMFLDEKISLFETIVDIDERNEDSFFEFPSDLYRLGVVTNKDNGRIIELTNHSDVVYLNSSPLTRPTASQPVYVIHKTGLQVWPYDESIPGGAVDKINMVYIKTPADPSVVFTLNEENENVFSSKSDFELHESEFQDLVAKICAYAGVVVRAPEVTAFAQGQEGKIAQTEV